MTISFRVRLAGRETAVAASLVAFAVAAIIRAIPQLQFPYPIGFDTPVYLWLVKISAAHPSPFRFYEDILALAYLAGANMLVVMEVLPILVYGLLGFSVYSFSRRALGWNTTLSLFVSFDACFSVALLRSSWDLHDQTFGLALLLITLPYLGSLRGMKLKGKALFGVLVVVTSLTHQFVMVLLLAILLVEVWRTKAHSERLAFTLLFVIGTGIFVGAWYGERHGRILGWVPAIFQSAPFSGGWHALDGSVGVIVGLFALSLPFAVYGFFKERRLATWLFVAGLGSLSTLLTPTFLLGGVDPWRYVILLGVPLSFYTVNGFNRLGRRRASALLLVGVVLVNIGSFSFLGLTTGLNIYQREGIIPSNMVQSTIPLFDIGPTLSLLQTVPNTANATLLVDANWLGWANFYTNARIVGFGGFFASNFTLQNAMNGITNKSNLFLLWWDGPEARELGFVSVSNDSGLQLFKYAAN